MTQQPTCTTCPRKVPDTAYGCRSCGVELSRLLDQLAPFLPELQTTIARQDRMGGGGARPAGAEIPLPYRDTVAEKADAVRGELATWARVVHDETCRYLVGDTPAAHSRYLAEATDWARYRQQWPEFYAALRPLLGCVLSLIDHPPDRVYLGPCRAVVDGQVCWADVLAKPNALTGTCPVCKAVHEVAKSREWLLRSLLDALLTPSEMATVLRGFGDASVGYSTIAAYAADGRIVAHGEDSRGRPLYRVGDVLDVRAASRRRGRLMADTRA